MYELFCSGVYILQNTMAFRGGGALWDKKKAQGGINENGGRVKKKENGIKNGVKGRKFHLIGL